MPIRTRRWNDAQEEGDGWRVLVTRYRPRGVSKGEETWHEWTPALGPSKALHALVYGKAGEGAGIPWATYRQRYLLEMRERKPEIRALADRVAAGETVTLLCSSACDREARCHRSILKELIEREVAAMEQDTEDQTPKEKN